MKLRSTSLSYLALAATLALASCGGGSSDSSSNDIPGQDQSSDKDKKKKKGKGGEILPQFRGAWVLAEQILGEADPKAKGCQVSEIGSFTAKVNIDKKAGLYETMNFVGVKDCSGSNTIAEKMTFNYEVVSATAESQILRPPLFSYTYAIAGELTIKMMNEANVCGHSDWKAGTYKSTDKKMQTCIVENTFNFVRPYQMPDAHKHILERFRPAGKGMVIETRDSKSENSEFGLPLYLARP